MGDYKHIENCIAGYIARHYRHPVEVGIGNNLHAARTLADAGIAVRCTDIRDPPDTGGLVFFRDDVFSPDISRYAGADLIYAIRPAIEMVPALIDFAKTTGCDLLVYHLGFEVYGNGGGIIDCGVLLHRYWSGSEPVKER
jgi:uncharacterized UPF0146 family protein